MTLKHTKLDIGSIGVGVIGAGRAVAPQSGNIYKISAPFGQFCLNPVSIKPSHSGKIYTKPP